MKGFGSTLSDKIDKINENRKDKIIVDEDSVLDYQIDDVGILNIAYFTYDKDDDTWIEEGIEAMKIALNDPAVVIDGPIGKSAKCNYWNNGVSFALQNHEELRGYIYITHIIWLHMRENSES